MLTRLRRTPMDETRLVLIRMPAHIMLWREGEFLFCRVWGDRTPVITPWLAGTVEGCGVPLMGWGRRRCGDDRWGRAMPQALRPPAVLCRSA